MKLSTSNERFKKSKKENSTGSVASVVSCDNFLNVCPQIALQFPDELLPHSVPIFKTLRSRLASHRELYALADTTYGR